MPVLTGFSAESGTAPKSQDPRVRRDPVDWGFRKVKDIPDWVGTRQDDGGELQHPVRNPKQRGD